MATTSAWAVGSFVAVTRLTPSATTRPSFTTTAANGPPPSRIFSCASAMARCINSVDIFLWSIKLITPPPFVIRVRAGLRRKLGQRFGEHQCSAGNILRRSVLVGTMTEALAAGDEQHTRGRDARHEQRIVIRAADHLQEGRVVLLAGVGEGVDDARGAVGGGVGGDLLGFDVHVAFFRYGLRGFGDGVEDAVAARKIGVANVEA